MEALGTVMLTVQAELCRTQRKVKELIRLQIGAVIQFDKEVGEPVEILVDEQLIARGNVVEVDGLYGVQITEILK
jgi:flagellar motor switch protein FliN